MTNLFDLDLLDALEASVEERWESHVWRQVVSGTDPLRTNGFGGRWNPPGVEVLYCALSKAGAVAELSAVLDRQPVPVTKPRQIQRLAVRLTNVAVLSDSPSFETAGVTTSAVLTDDWSVPRRVGAACEWLGMTGLVVPSARHDDRNLIILVNNLQPGDYYDLDPIAEGA